MKNLKENKGITLIALVITIIVLLILAGVSLSMVLSQDGIFSRAEQATDKYGQAKARETLEMCLSEAQMRKYESGLTEEQLDQEIEKVGSLLPKEDENSKYQLVIVEGHIFEVDRSVPKIVDYKGPVDGVIITARITQNGDWQNPVATVTGTITKYGGGTVTSSTATATEGVTITGFPTAGGSYTIPNITKDTDITITASADDGKPAVTKTIKVRLVRDITGPEIRNQSATASMMKITISANAVDTESGLASLTYSVSPADKVKDNKATGTLTSGVPLEVEATAVGNYTVTFTATDNAGNSSTATSDPVRASDAISVADLKNKINAENYPDYLGMKVDYNPEAGGTWRVFYYDATGEFGDGEGTIYLERDYDTTMTLINYYKMTSATANGLAMMKQLNPDWRNKDGVANLGNEKAAAGLCDTDNWTRYKTNEAKYAIGAPSIEMWIRAYNAVYPNSFKCGILNINGYGFGQETSESLSNSINTTVNKGKNNIFYESGNWLASPSSSGDQYIVKVDGKLSYHRYDGACGYRPVVSLKH